MDAPTAIAAGLVLGSALVAALPKDFTATERPDAREAAAAAGDEDAAEAEKARGEDEDDDGAGAEMTPAQAAAEEEAMLRRRGNLEAAGVDVDKVQRLIRELETEGNENQRRIERMLISAMSILFVVGCLAIVGFLVSQHNAATAMYH